MDSKKILDEVHSRRLMNVKYTKGLTIDNIDWVNDIMVIQFIGGEFIVFNFDTEVYTGPLTPSELHTLKLITSDEHEEICESKDREAAARQEALDREIYEILKKKFDC